jgi:hypothetical protein
MALHLRKNQRILPLILIFLRFSNQKIRAGVNPLFPAAVPRPMVFLWGENSPSWAFAPIADYGKFLKGILLTLNFELL